MEEFMKKLLLAALVLLLAFSGCNKKQAETQPAASGTNVSGEGKFADLYAQVAALSDKDAYDFFNSLKDRGLSQEDIVSFFIGLPISRANKEVYDLYIREGFPLHVDTLPPVNFYENYAWKKGEGTTITGPYSNLTLKMPFSNYVPLPEGPIGDPKKTYKIGVVFHGFDHSWLIDWADCAKWEADKHSNVQTTVLDARYDNQQMATYVDQFIAEGMDGILMWPMEVAPTAPPAQRAIEAGIPLVTSDRLSGYEEVTSRVFGGFPANGAQFGMYLIWKLGQEGAGFNAKMVMLRKPLGSSADGVRTGHLLKVISYFPGIQVLGSYHDADSKEDAFRNAQSALQSYQDIDVFYGSGDHEGLAACEAIRQAGRFDSRKDGKRIIVICPDDSKEAMKEINDGYLSTDVPYTPLQSDVAMRVLLKAVAGENVPHDVTLPNIVMVTKDGAEIFGVKTQTTADWYEYTFGPPL
jgi:ribose transport system substrate-binding protein